VNSDFSVRLFSQWTVFVFINLKLILLISLLKLKTEKK
jgi:hypothetical protein